MRHVAIHLFKTQQTLEVKDSEADEVVVMAYINGPHFLQSINHIDKTMKDAQDARNCLTQMRTYVNTNICSVARFIRILDANR
jgi:hypothetical protein